MKNVIAAYGHDREATEEGVWHEFYDGAELVCKIKIRPENTTLNRDWRKATLQIAKDVREWINKNGVQIDDVAALNSLEIPEDVDIEITAGNYFGACVVDWEVIGEDDKKMRFTRNNFVKVMQAAPLLFDMIRKKARVLSTFKISFEEDAVKS